MSFNAEFVLCKALKVKNSFTGQMRLGRKKSLTFFGCASAFMYVFRAFTSVKCIMITGEFVYFISVRSSLCFGCLPIKQSNVT